MAAISLQFPAWRYALGKKVGMCWQARSACLVGLRLALETSVVKLFDFDELGHGPYVLRL